MGFKLANCTCMSGWNRSLTCHFQAAFEYLVYQVVDFAQPEKIFIQFKVEVHTV